jgi:O-antigen/teichoic acid export membrane protein
MFKWLGSEKYGYWVVLNAIWTLASSANFGLETALPTRMAKFGANGSDAGYEVVLRTSFWLYCGIGILAGGLVALFSPLLAISTVDQTEVKDFTRCLRVVGIGTCLRLMQQWIMAVQAGAMDFRRQAYVETVATIITGGVTIILSACYKSLFLLTVWSALAAGGAVVAQAVATLTWRHLRGVLLPPSGIECKELLRLGGPQWMSNIGSLLFSQADRIIVSATLGSSAAGIYGAASAVTGKINELSALPLKVMVPVISKFCSEGAIDQIRSLLRRAVRANCILVFGLAVPVLAFSGPIAAFIAPGTQERLGETLVRTLALTYAIYSLNAAGFYAAVGLGRPALNARWNLAGGGLTCALMTQVASRFGLVAAAWCNLAHSLTLLIDLEVARNVGFPRGEMSWRLARSISVSVIWFYTTQRLCNAPVGPALAGGLMVLIGLVLLLALGFEAPQPRKRYAKTVLVA